MLMLMLTLFLSVSCLSVSLPKTQQVISTVYCKII